MNKLVVGPFDQGIRKDRTAFIIDNDSFPELINAYQWRGRVKRKRGTSLLGRLQRLVSATGASTNLITDLGLEPIASIVPGSISIIGSGGAVWIDDGNGVLTSGILVGTINYATGAFTGPGVPLSGGTFSYYTNLPVMGLEDLDLEFSQFPGTIAFDTTYSYDISPLNPYTIKDVSFYKNPLASALLPGYTPKTTATALTWNGQNYRQFWTVNYQNALWATNGVEVPFTGATLSMQFRPVINAVVNFAGPPAVITFEITGHNLVPGDFLFFNEFLGTFGTQVNFQTGYVVAVPD